MQHNINTIYDEFIKTVIEQIDVPLALEYVEDKDVIVARDSSNTIIFMYYLNSNKYQLLDKVNTYKGDNKYYEVIAGLDAVNKFEGLHLYVINAVSNLLYNNIKFRREDGGSVVYDIQFGRKETFKLLIPYGDVKYNYLGTNLFIGNEEFTLNFENKRGYTLDIYKLIFSNYLIQNFDRLIRDIFEGIEYHVDNIDYENHNIEISVRDLVLIFKLNTAVVKINGKILPIVSDMCIKVDDTTSMLNNIKFSIYTPYRYYKTSVRQEVNELLINNEVDENYNYDNFDIEEQEYYPDLFGEANSNYMNKNNLVNEQNLYIESEESKRDSSTPDPNSFYEDSDEDVIEEPKLNSNSFKRIDNVNDTIEVPKEIVPNDIKEIRVVALKYGDKMIGYRIKTDRGAYDIKLEKAREYGLVDFRVEKVIKLENMHGFLVSKSEKESHTFIPDVSNCDEDCSKLMDLLFS